MKFSLLKGHFCIEAWYEVRQERDEKHRYSGLVNVLFLGKTINSHSTPL